MSKNPGTKSLQNLNLKDIKAPPGKEEIPSSKSSKKLPEYHELSGNTKRKKLPKEESSTNLKSDKRSAEPMIIPLKPERVKEKTVIKEESKIVYVPQSTQIIKHIKEKKTYPKYDEYEETNIALPRKTTIVKYFRPKIKKRHFTEENEFIKEDDHESDGSFVKVEIPLTIIQHEIPPEIKPMKIERRANITLIGTGKPESIVETTDDFFLKSIRVYKGQQEICDFEDQIDEVIFTFKKRLQHPQTRKYFYKNTRMKI